MFSGKASGIFDQILSGMKHVATTKEGMILLIVVCAVAAIIMLRSTK